MVFFLKALLKDDFIYIVGLLIIFKNENYIYLIYNKAVS